MKRLADEFRKAALEKNINWWSVHSCSMCDYSCGFMLFIYEHEVIYDHGCDCVRNPNKTIQSWEHVAEIYNMQSHPDVIKNMNEFWGFEND